MRGNELLDNMELVGSAYVEAAAVQQKTRHWVRWVALAACLSLIIATGMLGNLYHSPDTPDNRISSYFVMTAYAAEGELTELELGTNCFNSSPSQEGNVFGVDMPLFNFSVQPTNLKGNEALYSQFDISVSYNGVTVEGMDEHIMVAYLIPMQGSGEPWAYSISGWFTEPTSIIINISEKESRQIVETFTVSVRYHADQQEYELELTNLTSKFAEQKEAAEANNALMEYFFDQGYVTDYPTYFGGCYIENNKLHIKLVSPTDEEMKEISAVLSRYGDTVVYHNSKMSMSDLQAYADKTAKELIAHGYAVTLWYVDSISGNIVIEVLEEDLSEATAWVADNTDNQAQTQIIIEKGSYISLD